MPGFLSQIWVTSVLCDEDVPKALRLSFSLRRAFTTRQVAAIASPTISPDMMRALNRGMDLVFFLEENLDTRGLGLENFAKIYSLKTFRAFSNCVFVSPTLLALKNCDDIFTKSAETFVFLENDEDTSIFLFKPSLDSFEALMKHLRSLKTNDASFGNDLRNWSQNQTKTGDYIPQRYCKKLDGQQILGFENEISMVNLLNYPSKDDMGSLENQGILGKLISIYCLKIHQENVLPLLHFSEEFRQTGILETFLGDYVKEPVAVVGMSCRFPGANNVEEFWNFLMGGEAGTRNPPEFRWLREQCSVYRADARKVNAGFLKVPVDEFDARFFGISPEEAECMDPQHRLLHELVWEGLEDACVDPHALRGTSGSVFMGSWLNDYKDILANGGNQGFFRSYMGNSIGAAAARISFLLGMTGPSVSTESGCSSAMVAVHMACQALLLHHTDLALACGINLLLNPFGKGDMPLMVSPDGKCRTFSEDANGFARAEGGGVLVLKRLSDALKDGDNIWGLIRGSAMSQEGTSKSMGTPTVQCEALALKGALNDANVAPHQVSYLESHGTGTLVGDPMEVAAIAEAYHSPKREEPLIIGSVKTNVGHTESCSGITGIMKVILAMKHELIPAHKNFTKLNPSIDLTSVPAVIPINPIEWKKIPGESRLAGVSSFGITGTDAHVIIEEPPREKAGNPLCMDNFLMERPYNILKLSTKTEEAMDLLLEKYKGALNTSEDSIADITFSANTGRANFPVRVAIIGQNKEQFVKAIESKNFMRDENSSENLGKICFLFTGQGSQYSGMAKTLYASSPVFRMYFDHCCHLVRDLYGVNIIEVLWRIDAPTNDEINRTIYSQTSIFCVEYALLKLWESWGVKPDYVLGHSLGEFCAAVGAGILSLEDAIKLVAIRSQLIDDLPNGKMLVIRGDQQQVGNMMKQFAEKCEDNILDYAAINSREQTVVAGDSDIIQKFAKFCNERSLKCLILGSTHAFHSNHMDPILEEYRKTANTIKSCGMQKCGYISGMKGVLISGDEIDAEYWVQHTRQKVDYLEASKTAVELGCRIFIEIGPQPVLIALTSMNNEANLLCLSSLKKSENDWECMLTSLGKLYVSGVGVDWHGFDQYRNHQKVQLPHYPFIRKKFWPDVVHSTGNEIHPLLGSSISNASSSKIFHSGLNLNNLNWAKDHVIGKDVIFPGAGYLEMCLAAGHAALESSHFSMNKPSRAMKVENLVIKSPLRFEEFKTSQVQTIVEVNAEPENTQDWDNVKIQIFRQVGSDLETRWLPHAKATMSPFVTCEEQSFPFSRTTFNEMISESCENTEISLLYESLSSVGLKFGNAFKTLEKLWRKPNGSILIKLRVSPANEEVSTPYILHPTILDAMIQGLMIPKFTANLKKRLCVPIKIGKFIWLSEGTSESDERFVYVYHNEDSIPTALPLDSAGTILCAMANVELVDTTVRQMEFILEQQTFVMPQLWEETWRPHNGPMDSTHNAKVCNLETFSSEEFFNSMVESYDDISPEMETILGRLDRLVYLNILRSLYHCGFEPSEGLIISEDNFIEQLQIKEIFRNQFLYFLRILNEENLLERVGSSTWRLKGMPLLLQEIEKELSSPGYSKELATKFGSTQLLFNIGENLGSILQGKMSPLKILFPESLTTSDASPVSNFYSHFWNLSKAHEMIGSVVQKIFKHCKTHDCSTERTILRICEIGTGTGTFTKEILAALESNGLEFQYTYTDISSVSFPVVEKMFAKHSKNMSFKVLDIEKDPISQNFVPAYYDFIFAFDVIHRTNCIKDTLSNLRMMLKPEGMFNIFEMSRANRLHAYLFGLLDGSGRFNDLNVRHHHSDLSSKDWKDSLEMSGFEVIESFPCLHETYSFICAILPIKSDTSEDKLRSEPAPAKTWIIFHQENCEISNKIAQKFSQLTNRKLIEVQCNTSFQRIEDCSSLNFNIRCDEYSDYVNVFNFIETQKSLNVEGVLYCWSLSQEHKLQENILRPFFYACKSILTMKKGTGIRLIALTRDIAPVDNDKSFAIHPSTILGFLKSLQNERTDMKCKCIDIGDSANDETGLMQIFYEIWNPGMEPQVSYYRGTRYVPKVVSLQVLHKSELELPVGCDRFQLVLPSSKSIADLKFGPLNPFDLKPDEVEVQVKTSALNFRDVLNILKPSQEFENMNSVGYDFAGVVKRVHPTVKSWQVGDEVMGVNMNGSGLPSHINLHKDDIFPVPSNMTLEEACTLPVVTATSYYCLIDVANLVDSDTVLIHTASGGVGLSVIEICKHIGAKIIATAGSKRKQNYLRSLGIQHVFHSRNTDYCSNILELTNGRGVDVVLNSLTSKGFKEATLKACAPGARFVEMSKLSIWKPEEVQSLRPDVKYTIVDVSTMDAIEWRRLNQKVRRFIVNQIVNPLPYVWFKAVNIRDALSYLQTAKHIGKVVCRLPEIRKYDAQREIYTPIFNSRSTYLITGGLGGIGFQVCKWMLKLGAKYVLLAGRNLPTANVQDEIERLNSKYNSKVMAVQFDVSSLHRCKDLIHSRIPNMEYPVLRGVMHAAGILHDGLIENQSWENLSSTFNAKVQGTLNLHEVTKTGANLEHFVMFSSIAAVLGSPGKSNHAAGNQFMDTFAHFRHSMGLPAVSINWGQWGEVGIATEVDLPGMKPFSTLQGLRGLEYALQSQRTQAVVCNIESFHLLGKLYPHLPTYFDERVFKNIDTAKGVMNLNTDEFWQDYDNSTSYEAKQEVFKYRLYVIFRNILKLDETDEIGDSADFQEIGLDSLMFLEVKNALQMLFGKRVTLNSSVLKDCNTIQSLSLKIIKIIDGKDETVEDTLSPDNINELIKEDCLLPEHIRAHSGQINLKTHDISTVLITGVTGTLGPYVLKELCKSTQITKIFCLIRKKKNVSAMERLLSTLTERELRSDIEMAKVQCIVGNVALSKLGMEDDIWSTLSNCVDAVVHCASFVHHMESYKKEKTSKSMRCINIDGLKNVLEFCCSGGKLKHIYCASSMVAVAQVNEEGNVSESWPEVDDYNGVTHLAYPITKFVGDVLMKEAVTRRGIPGKVFRFPLICGDSKTGRFLLDQNHFMLRYVFMLKSGVMPNNPFPVSALPVDVCAKLSVQLFLDSNAPFDIYNICNPQADADQQFVLIAKRLGYDVKVVDFAEFASKIQEATSDNSALSLFKDFYANEHFVSLFTAAKTLREWVLYGKEKEDFFKSKKLSKLIPGFYLSTAGKTASSEYIYKDLLYAKENGWLKKFGI